MKAEDLPAPKISIVVPGLNESESLGELAKRIDAALSGGDSYELIFVDDGSTDDTWKIIGELHSDNPRVRGLRMRRNFGKAMALSSGFRSARGELIIMMDADLQDDPADLPEFIRSEEHTSELQSRENLVCRLLLEKKKIHLKTSHMRQR